MKNTLIYKKINQFLTNKKYDNLKHHIIFFTFLIITLIIAIYHEPWRDEAQSYLLSHDSIMNLFRQLKNEGHPIIWYLILRIINLPYAGIWILPWLVTLVTAYIIIYKMDKPIINKILIILSSPILYISSSFARSYTFAILLIILLALIYKKRYTHYILYGILLALLINTHIIFCGFAASLVLIDIYHLFKDKIERKNKIIIIVIFIIGVLLLSFQILSLFDAQSELFDMAIIARKKYLLLFVNTIKDIAYNEWIGSIFATFLVYFMIILFREKQKALSLILFLSCLSFLAIMVFYYGGYYMHIMILVIIVFVYWQVDNKKTFHYIIGILFICPIIATYKLVSYDIKDYYSASKITSEFIKYNIDKQEKLYCVMPEMCTALVPYIPEYTFIDIQTNTRFTYTDWSINDHKIEFSIFFEIPSEELPNVNYFIVPKSFEGRYLDNFDTIYTSPTSNIEDYIILRRKGITND